MLWLRVRSVALVIFWRSGAHRARALRVTARPVPPLHRLGLYGANNALSSIVVEYEGETRSALKLQGSKGDKTFSSAYIHI